MLAKIKLYKTYIAAAGIALMGISKILSGDYSGLDEILAALALAGLRHETAPDGPAQPTNLT